MLEKLNARVKMFGVWDLALTKLGVLTFTIALVKLFPVLLNIRFRYLIPLIIIISAKPFYRFFWGKQL